MGGCSGVFLGVEVCRGEFWVCSSPDLAQSLPARIPSVWAMSGTEGRGSALELSQQCCTVGLAGWDDRGEGELVS